MVPRFEKRVKAYSVEISAVAIAIMITSFGLKSDVTIKYAIVLLVYLFTTIIPVVLSKGQSFGKRIQKIKVVKMDGSEVNPFILMLREIFKTVLSLTIIYMVVAYFAMTEKEVSRTIHDYIFKTKVIDLDTTKKKYNRDDHFLGKTDSAKKRGL